MNTYQFAWVLLIGTTSGIIIGFASAITDGFENWKALRQFLFNLICVTIIVAVVAAFVWSMAYVVSHKPLPLPSALSGRANMNTPE